MKCISDKAQTLPMRNVIAAIEDGLEVYLYDADGKPSRIYYDSAGYKMMISNKFHIYGWHIKVLIK